MPTGKSRQSIQRAVALASGFAGQALLSQIPGIQEVVEAGQIADLIDPFDYNNSWTREGLDDMSEKQFGNINDVLKSQANIEKQEALVNRLGPTMTEEEKKLTVEINTAYWRRYFITPPKYTECFQDYVHPEGSVSLSGPPTVECDNFYRISYDKYITDNKERYEQNEIKSGNQFIKDLNDLNELGIRDDLDAQRQKYLDALYAIIAVLVVTALVPVAVYLAFRYRR